MTVFSIMPLFLNRNELHRGHLLTPKSIAKQPKNSVDGHQYTFLTDLQGKFSFPGRDWVTSAEFEGKRYSVGIEAYDLNKIVLPDQRVLEASRWLESYPPKPRGLRDVSSLFTGMKNVTLEEIAKLVSGAVAKVVE